MKDYVILTDSCSDLGAEKRIPLGIEYIKMIVEQGENEVSCSLDWEDISYKDFYDNMRKGLQYRTTQITMTMYEEAFTKYLEAGKNILYIAMSTALSGSYNTSHIVRTEILKKYPDAKIICCDSLRGSLGEGFIVCKAAELRAQGKTIEEVAEWIEKNRNKVHQVGTVDDLVYLKRAGRVTGAAAVMGRLLKIKPIIISNMKGENYSIDKAIGRRTAYKKIVQYVKNNVINPEKQTLFLSHADCLEEAHFIRDEIFAAVKFKDCYIDLVGPVIGASVGPGMFGVYFFGKEVEV